MKDYYLVLGVPRREKPQGIRDAYRLLAKRYHPDRAGPGGMTRLQEIIEAYEVLRNEERRAGHDWRLRRAEARLDEAPDTIVQDVPGEPIAPMSIPRGFRRVHPSPEELLDRVLHNLLTGRATKGERLQALDAEVILSAGEAARGGLLRLGVPVFRDLLTVRRNGRQLALPMCNLRRPRRDRGRGAGRGSLPSARGRRHGGRGAARWRRRAQPLRPAAPARRSGPVGPGARRLHPGLPARPQAAPPATRLPAALRRDVPCPR